MGIKYSAKDLARDYGYLCFSDLLRIQREEMKRGKGKQQEQ